MTDRDQLRRTIRRSTAVIVVALGILTSTVADPGSEIIGLVMSAFGLVYLVASFVYVS
ncbi:MAG: hypothetical protein SVG88_12585 [Halobacteriales archaeon]|nr:hypothetical protein [Halobacteriales archaeon]